MLAFALLIQQPPDPREMDQLVIAHVNWGHRATVAGRQQQRRRRRTTEAVNIAVALRPGRDPDLTSARMIRNSGAQVAPRSPPPAASNELDPNEPLTPRQIDSDHSSSSANNNNSNNSNKVDAPERPLEMMLNSILDDQPGESPTNSTVASASPPTTSSTTITTTATTGTTTTTTTTTPAPKQSTRTTTTTTRAPTPTRPFRRSASSQTRRQ
jgi:hypothetical protein